MTELYSCGCTAIKDDVGNYLNGSYALWTEWYVDEDGEQIAQCYGVLCNKHIQDYGATKCKIGGCDD